MTEEVKAERTADDVMKEIEKLAEKPAEQTPSIPVEQKPETSEKSGVQTPVVDKTVKDEVKEETPVTESSKPKPTREEKDNHAFAEMRKKIADYEKELEQLRSEKTSASAPAVSKSESAPVESAPVTPEIKAEEVLDIYTRAKSGNLTEAELGLIGSEEQAIRLCESVLSEKISANDLYEARQKILASASPNKSEMADLAAKYLPVAQQRDAVVETKQKQIMDEGARAFNNELSKVKQEFAEMVNPESDLAKFMNEWDNAHMSQFGPKGEVIKQGKLPVAIARHLIAHPYEHAQMIKSYYDQVVTARGTAKELKKKVALSESPESGSPPSGESKKTRTAEDILKEMEAMAASGGRSVY